MTPHEPKVTVKRFGATAKALYSVALYCAEDPTGQHSYGSTLDMWGTPPWGSPSQNRIIRALAWHTTVCIQMWTESKEEVIRRTVAWLERRQWQEHLRKDYAPIATILRSEFPECFEGGKS